MNISINNNKTSNSELQGLPLAIKYDLVYLLRNKFDYKIEDIRVVFDKTRDTIQKWLAKTKSLDNKKMRRVPSLVAKNKPFINIIRIEEVYTIRYFNKKGNQSTMIDKKNYLIAGKTLEMLVEKNFSKSKLGRVRKEVFNKHLIDDYNKKIIEHINRSLLEYKPIILKNITDKIFIWNENKISQITNLLYKKNFSIKTIHYILSNIDIKMKFNIPLKLKQETQLSLIEYIWWHMTVARKHVIVNDIKKYLKKKKSIKKTYNFEHIDLYKVFDEIFQDTYVDNDEFKEIKKVLYNIIDTKKYVDTSISENFNKKIIKDTNLAMLIYQLSYHTTKKSILDIFINIAKSLYNFLKFYIKFNNKERNNPMNGISEFKIKKYIQKQNKSKKFNIYYSQRYKAFMFKNQHDLDFHLSSTYLLTKDR